MPNRILGVFVNVLLPLLIGVVTVGLFLLFMPQDATRLFYTNLGVTLWLEMVFWAYMGLLRMETKGVSVPFLAFLGVGAFFYMFCAGIWMLGYSLFLPEVLGYNVYLALHIVMLVVWMVVGTLMAQRDNAYHERVEQLGQDARSLDYFIQEMNVLYMRYRDVLSAKDAIALGGDDALEVLRNRMRGLTASVLEGDSARARLSALLEEGEICVAKLESAGDVEEVRRMNLKVQQFSRRAVNELELLKRLHKK